jgi:hypothetical protein
MTAMTAGGASLRSSRTATCGGIHHQLDVEIVVAVR